MSERAIVILLPPKPTPECSEVARRLSSELGCQIQSRKGRTVSGVFRDGAAGVIAISIERVAYHHRPGEEPFFFHPGLAKNRIGTLKRDEPDTLVRACELVEGDSFFDATLGKATDSLVAAHVVGDPGRVVGVEHNPVVASLVRLGLERRRVPGKALQAAMGRVEVRQGDHVEALRETDDGAYDLVYFDPFFEEQVRGSTDMSPLRRIGSHEGISAEALTEARRVARRRVVHKVRTDMTPPPAVADWELIRGKRRIGYRVWVKS